MLKHGWQVRVMVLTLVAAWALAPLMPSHAPASVNRELPALKIVRDVRGAPNRLTPVTVAELSPASVSSGAAGAGPVSAMVRLPPQP